MMVVSAQPLPFHNAVPYIVPRGLSCLNFLTRLLGIVTGNLLEEFLSHLTL